MIRHARLRLTPQGAKSASSVPLTFLLNDQFTTAESAPLTSPRTAEPGPGTQTISDDYDEASISGGKLVVSTSHNDYRRPVVGSLAIDRVAGGVVVVLGPFNLAAANLHMRVGTNDSIVDGGPQDGGVFHLDNGGDIMQRTDTAYCDVGAYAATTDYTFAMVVGCDCTYGYIKGGVYSAWTLLWVWRGGVTFDPLYACSWWYSHDGTQESSKVADLSPAAAQPHEIPAVGLDLCVPGTGTGTSSIAAPANGNTFVHDEGTKLAWTADNPLQAHTVRWRNDGSDYYEMAVAADGSFTLKDPSANTVISGGAASVGDGEAIEITHTTAGAIEVFVAATSTGTASGETENNGETAGVISTSGGITDFTARTLTTKDGLCTDVLAGPRSDEDTFTHSADGFLQFTLDSLPSSGNLEVAVRIQDATHKWLVRINSSGDLLLVEDNAGETNRISSGGALSGGETLRLSYIDNVYRLYYDNTLVGTYTDGSSLFVAQTSGDVALGTGGAVSNLIALDQPSGETLNALEAVENA